jgi:hypothetical protein
MTRHPSPDFHVGLFRDIWSPTRCRTGAEVLQIKPRLVPSSFDTFKARLALFAQQEEKKTRLVPSSFDTFKARLALFAQQEEKKTCMIE